MGIGWMGGIYGISYLCPVHDEMYVVCNCGWTGLVAMLCYARYGEYSDEARGCVQSKKGQCGWKKKSLWMWNVEIVGYSC